MLNLSSWTVTLPILFFGMLGVFLVIGILILTVLFLTRLTGSGRER